MQTTQNLANCAPQNEKTWFEKEPVLLYLEMEVIDRGKSSEAIITQPEVGVVSFNCHLKG